MDAAILLVACPDRRGLIHEITGVLARQGANIVANGEFVDEDRGQFFMRTEFVGEVDAAAVKRRLEAVLPAPAQIRISRSERPRIVILASKEHHCLGELLLLHAHGDLGATIEGVVSNHAVLGRLVQRFDLPFHHVPHDGLSREAHDQAVLEVLEGYRPDYLVLAKYMRVVGPVFVERYRHRMINIHHSFLPAFAGASPYRQAYARGVKIIGATAHFVTEALDEGPIIAQSVVPVDHTHSSADMARAGRDVEKLVLARALRLVFEQRVFLSCGRTVVFD
jgi:formyltetrahydrofolate deformylase